MSDLGLVDVSEGINLFVLVVHVLLVSWAAAKAANAGTDSYPDKKGCWNDNCNDQLHS